MTDFAGSLVDTIKTTVGWDNLVAGASMWSDPIGYYSGSNGQLEKASESGNNGHNFTAAVKGLESSAIDLLKRYWYVPVVVGGVFLGVKYLGANKTANMIVDAINKN